MIARFGPVWNSIVDGFGNHDPGAGRRAGMVSRWDVLHPGRAWASSLSGARRAVLTSRRMSRSTCGLGSLSELDSQSSERPKARVTPSARSQPWRWRSQSSRLPPAPSSSTSSSPHLVVTEQHAGQRLAVILDAIPPLAA